MKTTKQKLREAKALAQVLLSALDHVAMIEGGPFVDRCCQEVCFKGFAELAREVKAL